MKTEITNILNLLKDYVSNDTLRLTRLDIESILLKISQLEQFIDEKYESHK